MSATVVSFHYSVLGFQWEYVLLYNIFKSFCIIVGTSSRILVLRNHLKYPFSADILTRNYSKMQV